LEAWKVIHGWFRDFSNLIVTLILLGFLLFGGIVAGINLYHVSPYLIGIAIDRMIFRHRYRFRKPRCQEVPWLEINGLEFWKTAGAIRHVSTVEGIRILSISDELAERIEALWKGAKSDLGNATGN
jgi:hypothetical protein